MTKPSDPKTAATIAVRLLFGADDGDVGTGVDGDVGKGVVDRNVDEGFTRGVGDKVIFEQTDAFEDVGAIRAAVDEVGPIKVRVI